MSPPKLVETYLSWRDALPRSKTISTAVLPAQPGVEHASSSTEDKEHVQRPDVFEDALTQAAAQVPANGPTKYLANNTLVYGRRYTRRDEKA